MPYSPKSEDVFKNTDYFFKNSASSHDVQLTAVHHERVVFQNNIFTSTIFAFLPLKCTQWSQYFKQMFGKEVIKCHRLTRRYFLSFSHC